MKVTYRRRHVTRPEDYEAVELTAFIEIDSDNEQDADFFEGDLKRTGKLLSLEMDDLLDTDVDRTLRLDGQHINDSHLWKFYGRD